MKERLSRLRPASPALGAIILGLSAGAALSQTTADKLKFCDAAAELAVAVTAARDAGAPMADAEKLVANLVTDSSQRALFQAIVSLTYAMEGVEAPLMQEVTLQMCHKRTGLK